MEVYDDIGDQPVFLSAMRDCLEQSDLPRCIEGDGRRHTEVFQCA
jgi:hypothetical protein